MFRSSVLVGLAAAMGLGCPSRPEVKPSGAPGAGAVTRKDALSVLLITIDTLRADHMGTYGYDRPTSPRLDALGREGCVFVSAYTYWPKTRGSFVAMMTGRRASQTGYGKSHQMLLDFNPTLASTLKAAGYATTAHVDNPNVAASLGYAKGFDSFVETWEDEGLPGEDDRARAISDGAIATISRATPDGAPFFLWLHYVNPHAPYTPPAPFDAAFQDARAKGGKALPVVADFHGGIPRQWAAPKQNRLGYYVAQYDGEIAFVDQEVGRVLDALAASALAERTLVVVSSDHGESLGEHDYYFDHGENVFDPSLRIPLIVRMPGAPAGVRTSSLASTLDFVPTILDAVKVSYPPDLAGESLLRAIGGGEGPRRPRLVAQNDRNLSALRDHDWKIVATPAEKGATLALYDLRSDPGETRDAKAKQPDELRVFRRELELFQEGADREWVRTRSLLSGQPSEQRMSADACERLKALGYVTEGCS